MISTFFSIQIIPGIPEKSRKAEIYMRRLREMHDLCLANMAFSKRLVIKQTSRNIKKAMN